MGFTVGFVKFCFRQLPRCSFGLLLSREKSEDALVLVVTSGKFVFSCTEAYQIENGKKGPPVKGATLIGNGPDALTKVSMIGNDMELDPGVGTCGKSGQSVPVGVGHVQCRAPARNAGVVKENV